MGRIALTRLQKHISLCSWLTCASRREGLTKGFLPTSISWTTRECRVVVHVLAADSNHHCRVRG